MVCAQQDNMLIALNAKKTAISQQIVSSPGDVNLLVELAKVDNDIIQLEYEKTQEVVVYLSDKEKGEFRAETKTHTYRTNNLKVHCEQVFGLIIGQCMQLLQDKLKQDPSWAMVSKSYDPLQLYSLIEKVILKQTDDQYPFAAVVEQAVALFTACQGNMTNAQWYERFNTRYEVAKSVGAQFDNIEVLWEYCAGMLNEGAGVEYKNLSPSDQVIARANAEECLLAYLFIQNSSNQHDPLK